jgi:hypothetical protein
MRKNWNIEKSLADSKRSHSLKTSRRMRLSPKVGGELGVTVTPESVMGQKAGAGNCKSRRIRSGL